MQRCCTFAHVHHWPNLGQTNFTIVARTHSFLLKKIIKNKKIKKNRFPVTVTEFIAILYPRADMWSNEQKVLCTHWYRSNLLSTASFPHHLIPTDRGLLSLRSTQQRYSKHNVKFVDIAKFSIDHSVVEYVVILLWASGNDEDAWIIVATRKVQ